jgi:hypothetical protein
MTNLVHSNLQPLEHSEQRVLTTKQLAEFYKISELQITQNFNNNKVKFVEGKHFFLLKGAQLREFKNYIDNIYVVNSKSPRLYLWTERGTARHAKILSTEKAWDVFEELEDTYFRTQALKAAVAEAGGLLTRNDVAALIDERLSAILGERMVAIFDERFTTFQKKFQDDEFLILEFYTKWWRDHYDQHLEENVSIFQDFDTDLSGLFTNLELMRSDTANQFTRLRQEVQDNFVRLRQEMRDWDLPRHEQTTIRPENRVENHTHFVDILKGYVSVRSFATKHHLNLTREQSQNLGKRATAFCIEHGIVYHRVPTVRSEWDSVHVYPEYVLSEVFTEPTIS